MIAIYHFIGTTPQLWSWRNIAIVVAIFAVFAAVSVLWGWLQDRQRHSQPKPKERGGHWAKGLDKRAAASR